MSNQRLSIPKRAAVIAALVEGTPINAVCRMFRTGKHAVLRVIAETGEALEDYMSRNFRDLPCARIAIDEQWQYVGKHGHRMGKVKDAERGDFWLWCAVDPDTKLVFSYKTGRRDMSTGAVFMADVRARVTGEPQIATDNLNSYPALVRGAFGYDGYSYGTETKNFGEPRHWPGMTAMDWSRAQRKPVSKTVSSKRKAVVGSPNLGSLTTCHIERVFLSVRQELARFTRKTLAYSKDLDMHKAAINLHFGIYNLVRKHTTLGTTPAVAAGIEESRWTLERVVEMTEAYWQPKRANEQAEKSAAKRAAEDAVFLAAMAGSDNHHNA
jgi:IS1 family transposase